MISKDKENLTKKPGDNEDIQTYIRMDLSPQLFGNFQYGLTELLNNFSLPHNPRKKFGIMKKVSRIVAIKGNFFRY